MSRTIRTMAAGAAGVLCASAAVALTATPAFAAEPTYYVRAGGNNANACTEASPCLSIDGAFAKATAAGSSPTIDVGPGTFTSSTGSTLAPGAALLGLTIRGAGADETTLQATAGRVLAISVTYPVTLEGLRIAGGVAPAGSSGGGILATGGNLTIRNSEVVSNTAGAGGTGGTTSGIGGAGSAGGGGGGVAYVGSGSLTILGSTFAGNSAGTGGTGGAGATGTTGSTATNGGLLSNGKAAGVGGQGAGGGIGGTGGAGGAIAFAGTSLIITNSTLTGNTSGKGGAGGKGGKGGTGGAGISGRPGAKGGQGGTGGAGGSSGAGGGIAIVSSATNAVLTHVTVVDNVTGAAGAAGAGGDAGTAGSNGGTAGTVGTAGASGARSASHGLARSGTSVNAAFSLFANAPQNCTASAGTFTSTASIGTDASCGGLTVNPAVGGAALGTLGDFGGTTRTRPLLQGNPAISAIPATASSCTTTDQRGLPRPGRPGATTCAVGAFEPQGDAIAAPTITVAVSPAAPNVNGWFRGNVTLDFTCTAGSKPLTGAGCPADRVLSSNGAGQGGTFTVTNGDGLTAGIRLTINIDKSGPKIDVKGAKKGKLYKKARQLRCAASDSLSGVLDCQLVAKAKLVKKNTRVKVSYTAVAIDKAGNKTTEKGKYYIAR